MVSVSPGCQGVSRHREVAVALSVEGFHWWAPHVQGGWAIRWSPAEQCLFPFLDLYTWPLNWGKPQDVLFTVLCNGTVNFQTWGKCFCSGQYNAQYKGGESGMAQKACFWSNTNSKYALVIHNLYFLLWAIHRNSSMVTSLTKYKAAPKLLSRSF